MSKLDVLIGEINKQYKDTIIKKGTDMIIRDTIPFSSPRANYITYGGIPMGKATEFFGTEGGGKTTTALDIVKNAQIKAQQEYDNKIESINAEIQKLGDAKSYQKQVQKLQEELNQLQDDGPRQVAYVDTENTLDEEWAEKLGVDVNKLILIQPIAQTAEQVLQIILDVIDSSGVILIVLDSIPMLVSQNVFDESMEKKSYGGIAQPLATFSSKVSAKLAKNNTALIMINQVREDLSNPYNMYQTPGGRAVRHLYGLRIMFSKGDLIDENNTSQPSRYENPAGNLVQMKIIKTKVSKPDRPLGFYTLKYDSGIDVLSDTVDICLINNIIKQSGAFYSLLEDDGETLIQDEDGNDLKFQGKAKLLQYLRDTPIIYDELKERVMNKLKD